MLDRAGIQNITESAKIIQLQEDKFKKYYQEVEFIKSEYDRILDKVKPIIKNLLEPIIEDFELKLRPGMVTLTWTSMNIDSFIKSTNIGLDKMDQLIISLNDIIENRIENNLKFVSKIELVKLSSDSNQLTLDQFVEDQRNHIQKQANILIAKNLEIEKAVDNLLEKSINYRVDPCIEPINKETCMLIKQYYFWFTYKTLLKATQNSLNMMKDKICGQLNEDYSLQPLFEVFVKLENGVVTLEPSLEDIQKAINRAATAVLKCSKKLLGWDQISENNKSQMESYYKIIAQDKEIVKVILLLTGSIQGSKNKVMDFLSQFNKYKWLWTENIQENLR